MSAIGSTAPDFSLPDRHGEARTLAEYRGAPVVLVFFPYAFSPICTDELCHLQDHADMFEEFDAAVVCISTDSHFALDAFARQESYDFQMLSDHWPHGDVARRYGVLDEDAGCAQRHTITIDARGIIRDVSSADITQAREWDRLRGVLENLPRS
ncbi:redoxin domain-containing protein [Kocuria marina]|uniref:redoxin domain-containing protein n=1 Tax=Kocuria marina TaxID=223184 RepID=UPI0011AA680C|nr:MULTISPECIES: redoxin domain-containing protein [Kocuria]MCT2020254.1 redoxin domain-containing protein [Kocuria marina]